MTCRVQATPTGGTIVCGPRPRSGRCKWCSDWSSRLCDFRTGTASGTCDLPMCTAHAVSIGPDKDHCPIHAKAASP